MCGISRARQRPRRSHDATITCFAQSDTANQCPFPLSPRTAALPIAELCPIKTPPIIQPQAGLDGIDTTSMFGLGTSANRARRAGHPLAKGQDRRATTARAVPSNMHFSGMYMVGADGLEPPTLSV